MKSYTDLEQSKKLAEILSIESADMFYRDNGIDVKLMWEHNAQKVKNPCWSLAALLEALPSQVEIHQQTDGHKIHYRVESYMDRTENETYLSTEWFENSVDACVEMVLELHKQKRL